MFQEAGEIEAEIAEIGTKEVLKIILTTSKTGPPCLPKGKAFQNGPDSSATLPTWLSEDDLNYYSTKFGQKGFTGPLNYYRALDLYVSCFTSLTIFFFFRSTVLVHLIPNLEGLASNSI